MSFLMKSTFLRKLTFPLQLKHLKDSMEGGDLDWYSEVDEVVILGAIPLRKKSPWITELNLGGVVSLNEPHESKRTFSEAQYLEMGITKHVYNVKDHVGAANVQQAREIVDFIKEQGSAGKKVYIHCKAGKGRSASVVMCYLCEKLGITPEEAFSELQRRRKQVDLGRKQWRLVRRFHKTLTG